jgi:peptidoglycan hydrolase CwlO-like protein
VFSHYLAFSLWPIQWKGQFSPSRKVTFTMITILVGFSQFLSLFLKEKIKDAMESLEDHQESLEDKQSSFEDDILSLEVSVEKTRSDKIIH